MEWIVNGFTSYDAKGAAQRAYLAWFWSGSPGQFPLGTTPSSLYGRQRYDAFGRQLQTFGLDGSVTLQSVYHALSVDKWDAADLQPGPHQGTPASALQDGHGRTVAVTERIHGPGGIEARDTRTTYLSTGEPSVIARVRVGAADDPVVRTLQYDTLGRMVVNVEPDTSTASHAWRYAYDDNGDLVGTSDARGCGANYWYDAGGRIVAEDFSPCLVAQQTYSTPDLSTGNGTEAYYEYDALDADDGSIPGFAIDASLLLGRLVAVVDRGAKTVTRYDGRGRSSGIARRVAAPGLPSDQLAQRYAAHWFTQVVAYDGADRPVSASTGADVPELLDASGQSFVTTQYSKRGTVQSVGSGYGPLVASLARAADGPVSSIVYGDTAGTRTAFTYDSRRRLASVQTYRGPPALWSQQPPAYLPAPDPGGAPDTFQLLLQDLSFTYDSVDNPTQIRDFRNPAEWPAGAQPVTRTVQYDDLYRATNVAYAYPTGSDTWVDPFDAEDTGVDSDPRRARPSPRVGFGQRVLTQSFQFDWLGNTTSTDDDAHGFYDRSLGTIQNGTAANGPYQLRSAQGVAASARGGALTARYDAAGDLASLSVTRSGPCLPAGASCSQQFAYDWDEVGRLVMARRWDGGVAAGTPDAELDYAYDASDNRTLKTAVGAGADGKDAQTVYVLGSLELRRTTWSGTDYALHDASGNPSEVGYLLAHGVRLGRLHYALDSEPTATSGRLHVLFELPDHLGSTSVVVDKGTSELVEAATYLPYGGYESSYRPTRWSSFREDYGFTGKEEDVELGLAYFGKRFLSPALGRWASADPLTVHGIGADPNAYAYVHGALFGFSDPVGLQEAHKVDSPSGGAPAPDNPNDYDSREEQKFKGDLVRAAADVSRAVDDLAQGTKAGVPNGITGMAKLITQPSGLARQAIPVPVPVLQLAAPQFLQQLDSLHAAVFERLRVSYPDTLAGNMGEFVGEGLSTTALTMGAGAAMRTEISVARFAEDAPIFCPCFAAETEVETETGLRPIADVREGDLLWSEDPDTGERALRRVVRRYVTPDKPLVEVEVEDAPGVTEVIRATPGHPFWVEGRGWTAAENLSPDEPLRTSTGVVVRVIGGHSGGSAETVYNFDVEGWHTYFVGQAGSLVHNGCESCLLEGAKRRLPSPGDVQFSTQEDALAEALKRHGIDPATTEIKSMYGKNQNLVGSKGQPWERIEGLTEEGDIKQFDHHANGHYFEDTNEFEFPHYHGPNGEHLTYEPKP